MLLVSTWCWEGPLGLLGRQKTRNEKRKGNGQEQTHRPANISDTPVTGLPPSVGCGVFLAFQEVLRWRLLSIWRRLGECGGDTKGDEKKQKERKTTSVPHGARMLTDAASGSTLGLLSLACVFSSAGRNPGAQFRKGHCQSHFLGASEPAPTFLAMDPSFFIQPIFVEWFP